MKNSRPYDYPDGKDFIFTIFDDTDVATLDYICPIYDYLSELGIFTTKTVWPLAYHGDSDYKGSQTLEDNEYAEYIVELKNRGFEIGYHGPSMVSMDRKHVQLSFDRFHQILASYPRIYAAHSANIENLYWGASRFSIPVFRWLYAMAAEAKSNHYQGHVENSPYFWGDLALRHIDYVRSFTYREINLLNISNAIVYKNSQHQWVNNWFITADADNVEEFNQILNGRNQDRLEREGGVCIVSTHFGKGFLKNGKLNPRTRTLLKQMSERNGWFVPVSTALDFLRLTQQNDNFINTIVLCKLEIKWFLNLILSRGIRSFYEKTELPYLKRQIIE